LRDMTELWKKATLFGIGMWAITEEKIQDFTDELIENGEIRKEEGKKFVREVVDEQKRQREELENRITSRVQETFRKADYATRDEVRDLKEIIIGLESKIDMMVNKEKSTPEQDTASSDKEEKDL
jgi:polyhydroxyalkanoate synthesis regulator phasin